MRDMKCIGRIRKVLLCSSWKGAISLEEEGFWSVFSLDWKRHGVDAGWLLLICKANFIVMRA